MKNTINKLNKAELELSVELLNSILTKALSEEQKGFTPITIDSLLQEGRKIFANNSFDLSDSSYKQFKYLINIEEHSDYLQRKYLTLSNQRLNTIKDEDVDNSIETLKSNFEHLPKSVVDKIVPKNQFELDIDASNMMYNLYDEESNLHVNVSMGALENLLKDIQD